MMSSNARNYGYDILRVLACIMVVILHSPMPGQEASNHGLFLSGLSFFTAPCVPLFFMLSGALLLGTPQQADVFLRKRFSKFIAPLLIWTLLYLINKVIVGKINSIDSFIISILSIPFSSQEGVLWFMYTLGGLYLLTPVISPWLNTASKRTIEFYLFIWFITLLFPYFERLLHLHTLITPRADVFYYFSGFVGYYVLGWYLKRYQNVVVSFIGKHRFWILLVLGCIIAVSAKGIDKIYHLNLDEQDAFWFQSIAVAVFCVFWWYLSQSIAKKSFMELEGVRKTILFISNYSFGIYLMHILIMRPWLWETHLIQGINNYILQTFAVIIVDFLICISLCWLISLTPWSKYIIGYQPKKQSVS